MRAEFQSSPDPKAGRNLAAAPISGRALVPILARPEGRAQLHGLLAHFSGPMFQSSPDPKAGRNITGTTEGYEVLTVPILARPEGRAQRDSNMR